MTEPEPALEERHATWLELFFDLVAVAGIGMLAHLLQEDSSAGGLGIYVVAFVAFWLVWACFTAYGNIAGDRAHTFPMLVGMAVLGVMTAAVPEIHGEHATGFAIAYVVGRVAASRPWRVETVVADLPVVQALFGVTPWIVSWWFDGTTMYVLWAVGLALDLVLLLGSPRERLIEEEQSRLDRFLERLSRGGPGGRGGTRPGGRGGGRRAGLGDGRGPGGPGGPGPGPEGQDPQRTPREIPTTVSVADFDAPHLGERLGLFVLIVLGEGLVQIIDAASEATWDRALAVTGAGAFAFMIALWSIAVGHGYAGVALLPGARVGVRVAWVCHLVTTGAMATLVVVLGGLVADPGAGISDHDRWLLVAAYAGYAGFAAGVHLVLALRSREPGPRGEALGAARRVGVPMLVAAAVVLLRTGLSAEGVVWVLAGGLLVVVVGAEQRRRPRGRPDGAPDGSGRGPRAR